MPYGYNLKTEYININRLASFTSNVSTLLGLSSVEHVFEKRVNL